MQILAADHVPLTVPVTTVFSMHSRAGTKFKLDVSLSAVRVTPVREIGVVAVPSGVVIVIDILLPESVTVFDPLKLAVVKKKRRPTIAETRVPVVVLMATKLLLRVFFGLISMTGIILSPRTMGVSSFPCCIWAALRSSNSVSELLTRVKLSP